MAGCPPGPADSGLALCARSTEKHSLGPAACARDHVNADRSRADSATSGTARPRSLRLLVLPTSLRISRNIASFETRAYRESLNIPRRHATSGAPTADNGAATTRRRRRPRGPPAERFVGSVRESSLPGARRLESRREAPTRTEFLGRSSSISIC